MFSSEPLLDNPKALTYLVYTRVLVYKYWGGRLIRMLVSKEE
jgi:hypothetical protein